MSCVVRWEGRVAHEEPLEGGNASGAVVRIGETVRKPWSASTASVVAYVEALRSAGVDAPTPMGRDEYGRQVQEFVAAFLDGYRADDRMRRLLPDVMVERTAAMYNLLRTSHVARRTTPARNLGHRCSQPATAIIGLPWTTTFALIAPRDWQLSCLPDDPNSCAEIKRPVTGFRYGPRLRPPSTGLGYGVPETMAVWSPLRADIATTHLPEVRWSRSHLPARLPLRLELGSLDGCRSERCTG